jgi:alkyl hydroperoxide reductase subunit AhpF
VSEVEKAQEPHDERNQDAADWELLTPYLENLPKPVKLVVWADPEAQWREAEAVRLARMLSERYDALHMENRPRRPGYDFWPVIGVMGYDGDEERDVGVRVIGLPSGAQLTALLGAIQAVSFQGQHVSPKARIQLSRLSRPVDIEVITGGADESGPEMATQSFGLAVCSPQLRAFLIMADQFPVVVQKYMVHQLPHTVLNGRVHIEGVVDTDVLMRRIAAAAGP